LLVAISAGNRFKPGATRIYWIKGSSMKIISKKILPAIAIGFCPAVALAQNVPLTCWYSDHADFTSASPASADATVGSVTKAGRGEKTYSYTISARDGSACPVQLPLSTETAVTVALVRQDEGNCSNDNVSDAPPAAVGGSVTIARSSERTTTAGIKLAGVSPNTSYRVAIKCGRQLGTLRTDDQGNAGRTVDFLTETVEPAFAFEVSPEGGAPGTKLQSLALKK
jgi:hypothetical protein